MARDDWRRFITVDVVIETTPLGLPHPQFSPESLAQRARVERDLLTAAPNAYRWEIKLSTVWSKLSLETRLIVARAVRATKVEIWGELDDDVRELDVVVERLLCRLAERAQVFVEGGARSQWEGQ
jgi:hypothetical protein